MRWHARSLLHLHLVTADHMTETNLFRFFELRDASRLWRPPAASFRRRKGQNRGVFQIMSPGKQQ